MLCQESNEEVGLLFVIPSKCSTKDDCDVIMSDMYKELIEKDFHPQWLTEQKCLSLQPDKRNVFVFQEFGGEAFEYLKQFKCVLVGPRCLETIFRENTQLPHLPYPYFTMSMHGLIIAASGFGRERKEEIRKKVELMGGLYSPQLKAGTTHLLVNSVQSEKYAKALAISAAIMTEDWLDAVYSVSLKGPVKATDPQFNKFRCPPFKGLTISSSKLSSSHRKRIADLIQANGGTHVGTLSNSVNLLIIGQPEGDKLKYARSWGIPCLNPSWVYDSVQEGRNLSIEKYELPVSRLASTPERDEKFHQFEDMSVMSNIAPGEHTHLDETMMNSMMSDASRMSSVSYFKPPIQSRNVDGRSTGSGVFVKPVVPPVPSPQKRALLTVSTASRPRNLTPKKKTSPAQFKHLLDELDLQKTKQAGPFLDGCKVFLYGFNAEHEEKLRRVLKGSGASRFTELSDSVTHVLLGADCDPTFSKQLKELSYRPHVVTLQWLLHSVSLRRPASEEQYLYGEAETKNAPETPSPLSKKGLALLQRGDESPVAERENESRAAETIKLASTKSSRFLKGLLEPDKTESDLTAFYRNESSADKPPQIPPAHPSFRSGLPVDETNTPADESAVCSQTDEPVFGGLKFLLVGLAEEACEEVSKLIVQYGGQVMPRNFKGIPDYAIVPITGTAVSTANEIVTALWVEDCIFLNQIIAVEYFHRPITVHKGKYPLKGCVIGMSGYTRKERVFLMEVTGILGGLAQEIFAKKDYQKRGLKASTHLVCNAAEGQKFEAAKKWKLPAVRHSWLLDCCKNGTQTPIGPHLIVPDQEVRVIPVIQADSVAESDTNSELESREGHSVSISDGAIESVANANLEGPKENVPLDEPKTPIRPLALQRVAGQMATESPYHMRTPDTPYGISENPSPGERKRIKKWIDSIPDYPRSPVCPNRRLSTPMSEIRRQVWAKFGIPTPQTPEENKPGYKRPSDQTEETLPQSSKRARLEEEADATVETPPGPDKVAVQKTLFSEHENVSRAKSELEEANKLLQEMPMAGITSGTSAGACGSASSPLKEMMAPPKAQKQVSQPYCINWEDPVTVAEGKNAPQDEQRSSSSSGSGSVSLKRNVEEEEDRPPKRTSVESKNAEIVEVSAKEEVRKKRVFMLSSIDDRDLYAKMLEALGGKMIQGNHFEQSLTHLIVDKPVRSEKLLGSIASGKWVLHASYIDDSYKAGRFLEEENYEWGAPENEKLTSFLKPGSTEYQLAAAAHRWRKQLSGNGVGAFSGVRAVLGVESSTKIDGFRRLIEAGGGVVLQPNEAASATHYLVDQKTCPDGLNLADNVPVLPLMYLNNFLVKYPPPKIEDCVIKYGSHHK